MSGYRYTDVADLVGGRRELIDAIATVADCDARSVVRVLRGDPVRPRTARRVIAAARRLGVAAPIPPHIQGDQT